MFYQTEQKKVDVHVSTLVRSRVNAVLKHAYRFFSHVEVTKV